MLDGARYLVRLLCGLGWQLSRPGRRVAAAVAFVALAAVVLASAAAYGGEREGNAAVAVDRLEERAVALAGKLKSVEDLYAEEIAPLERVLVRYRSDDQQLVRRIAVSLLREARRTEMDPMLLLAVLLVENPALDPSARSFMGAQGLMQVMPFHRGKWPPCEPRLDDVESNICHGASIFASYLKQTGGDVDRALLRYNGCVHGTNTPNCHQYANHVFARAGRASVHAWLGAGTMGASP